MELLLLVRPDLPTERGDIIAARPDGFVWGRAECLGDFLVVRLENAPELTAILETRDDDGLGWYVDVAQIPAAEIAAAQSADWHVIDVALDAIEAR
ncbi:hypothetical protein [Solidesulfovibrio sp.]